MTDKCNICDKEYQHRGWLSRHKRLKDHYDEIERLDIRMSQRYLRIWLRRSEKTLALVSRLRGFEGSKSGQVITFNTTMGSHE